MFTFDALSPVWRAAVLLLGRAIAEEHELERPSVEAIVTATGASKSRAYELAAKLAMTLPTLVRSPGRPAKERYGVLKPIPTIRA